MCIKLITTLRTVIKQSPISSSYHLPLKEDTLRFFNLSYLYFDFSVKFWDEKSVE